LDRKLTHILVVVCDLLPHL
jgi:hypothetical protein